ncbi:follistatin-related protein 1-like isoform 2-T3 [Salvelinus alpinus]
MQSYADQESNKLLRSLCVDALIEMSDENTDWKLSFDEFLNCLKPGFNPPEKKCALEDETYKDGAETQVECNRCVCACGNWVCTAMTCNDKTAVVEETGEAGQEMAEEEWSLRVAELNKHQETVEKMKASTKEA